MNEASARFKVLISLCLVLLFVLGFLAGMLYHAAFLSPGGVSQLAEVSTLRPMERPQAAVEAMLVAVTQHGTGMTLKASVEIKPGEGRVLFATNPFVEPDTQQSVVIAARVAQHFTGKSLRDKDVIFSIEVPEEAKELQLVGGPSAGAALTLATIAAIEGKNVPDTVAITGTIQPDGTIGPVGGIFEKAKAAAEHGVKRFFVPRGQSKVLVYEPHTEERRGPGFVYRRIYYTTRTLDLNQEFARDYGMQVMEVSDISELVRYVLA
jgi:uncharacterized protein